MKKLVIILFVLGVFIMPRNIIVHYGQDSLDHMEYISPLRAVDAIVAKERGARFTATESASIERISQRVIQSDAPLTPSEVAAKIRAHRAEAFFSRHDAAAIAKKWYDIQAGTEGKQEAGEAKRTTTTTVTSAKKKQVQVSGTSQRIVTPRKIYIIE